MTLPGIDPDDEAKSEAGHFGVVQLFNPSAGKRFGP